MIHIHMDIYIYTLIYKGVYIVYIYIHIYIILYPSKVPHYIWPACIWLFLTIVKISKTDVQNLPKKAAIQAEFLDISSGFFWKVESYLDLLDM